MMMPPGASRIERVPETMLERVIVPISHGVLRFSNAARRLQHGRLQAYVLYLVVGLVVMGFVVWLGGKP